MTLLKVQGLCGRGGRKIARARDGGWRQENNIIQTQQDCYTWELTETMTAHTGSTQVRAWQNPTTEKERWTQYPSPNQEAVCNWHLLGKGCLNGMSLVYQPHSRASLIPRSCCPIQSDFICTFMYVCMHTHTFLLWFVIFCLIGVLFVCLFWGREEEKERERMKLGGNDLGGIGGRERYT